MKTKFIVIGYGWRADFFYRIAKLLPEHFEISAGVLRTQERAEQIQREEGVFATSDLEEALKTGPDFAVLCVPRGIVRDYLVKLMEKKIPVLCETPPGKDTNELTELWETVQKLQGKVQVIEQYFLQPYYAAVEKIIGAGYLGEVSNVMLSALHGYHAMSIYRRLLGTGYENCTIQGKRFFFELTATNGREGFDYSGKMIKAERDWACMEFESGKTGFFDFSGEQYFSTIRERRWNIQGNRGEINDMTVRFLNQDNMTVQQQIQRVDVGINNNSQWAHKGMLFLDKQMYENPYYPARMNDDEIAVASCLSGMKNYIETGEECYSLREALQDTYLSFMLEEAIETGKTIKTETQIWAE